MKMTTKNKMIKTCLTQTIFRNKYTTLPRHNFLQASCIVVQL